jgi:predicted ribosome-associated RNA-binding protein Tma20
VKPAGLDPSTVYDVTSVDVGVIGTATGADLMADGIEVRQSSHSAAHILIVTAKAQ